MQVSISFQQKVQRGLHMQDLYVELSQFLDTNIDIDICHHPTTESICLKLSMPLRHVSALSMQVATLQDSIPDTVSIVDVTLIVDIY